MPIHILPSVLVLGVVGRSHHQGSGKFSTPRLCMDQNLTTRYCKLHSYRVTLGRKNREVLLQVASLRNAESKHGRHGAYAYGLPPGRSYTWILGRSFPGKQPGKQPLSAMESITAGTCLSVVPRSILAVVPALPNPNKRLPIGTTNCILQFY